MFIFDFFGRLNAGLEFATDEEFYGYTCEDFEDGIDFSHNEVPASTFIRMVGSVKRDEYWNKPARITELVAVLYKSREIKLFHGFLREHGNTFYRIIAAELALKKILLPTFLP